MERISRYIKETNFVFYVGKGCGRRYNNKKLFETGETYMPKSKQNIIKKGIRLFYKNVETIESQKSE